MDICPRCKEKPEPEDETWPGKDHEEICQLCWEQECDNVWREHLEYWVEEGKWLND